MILTVIYYISSTYTIWIIIMSSWPNSAIIKLIKNIQKYYMVSSGQLLIINQLTKSTDT